MLPELKDLQKAYVEVLKFYDDRLKTMKVESALKIDELRRTNSPFLCRKHYLEKAKWIDERRLKIRKCKMPPVGEWVGEFPVGEWTTNGRSFEENLFEFVKKKFELCYLQI